MGDMKRVVPVLLGHIVAGFIVCGVLAYFSPVPDGLIDPFVAAWRIRLALIRFVSWVPALHVSGLLVGYSLAFGKTSEMRIERWSGEMLQRLKGAFLVCLVGISCYVILAEGFLPFVQSARNESLVRSRDYADYMRAAGRSKDAGALAEAEAESAAALEIWPDSKDATDLHESVRYLLASSRDQASGEKAISDAGRNDGKNLPGSKGLTALAALDLSREYSAKNDFYSAHYYAMLAWNIAPPTDPNRETALRLASAAWNRLGEGLASDEQAGDRDLFATKKKGYDAIQNGDYLTAYYIFLSLGAGETAAGDGKKDPDIARFLEVARQGVLDSVFFTDETGDAKKFESSRDIFFVARHAGSYSEAVFIRGVSWIRSGARDMAYLRDFEYARIDADGRLQYRIAVPYAKMFSYVGPDGRLVPEVLLHSVDRSRKGVETLPLVLEGTLPAENSNILVLGTLYGDFPLIVAATKGVQSMTLVDLVNFEPRAEQYGFSAKVYRCEIINRLSDPFIMLILSVYALVFAWRFRLGGRVLFKAWWVLALPLFPFLSMFAIDLARYLTSLGIVAIVRAIPQNPLLLVVLLLTLWFTSAAIWFFAQRSD